MSIFQTLLISCFIVEFLFPEMSQSKILDFYSDNPLFHPFVQKIRNYRSKDYLIKLLKRNLDQKLRKNRKPSDDAPRKVEKTKCNCNCKCNDRNFGKRCEHCEHCHSQDTETNHFKNFICESEGSFANPNSCRQFYICFHNEMDPIEVTCPKGFAFDSNEGKCTRKAARECVKKQMSIYKN